MGQGEDLECIPGGRAVLNTPWPKRLVSPIFDLQHDRLGVRLQPDASGLAPGVLVNVGRQLLNDSKDRYGNQAGRRNTKAVTARGLCAALSGVHPATRGVGSATKAPSAACLRKRSSSNV